MAAAENARTSTPPLVRRFSADISQLSPARAPGTLITSAGAEAASKARQLRHAATFSLAYQDSDAGDGPFNSLLRRHLLTQHQGSSKTLLADAKDHGIVAVATPPKKLSAKVERALQARDQCERDLERYCEAKHRAPRGSMSPSAPCRAELLDKSYWRNPENVHDDHALDKLAFDRLMRKLSPAMKNIATTHADLVHLLHACAECSLRATFCPRCATRASEFFENYTPAELQTLYGRELPAPDSRALAAFSDAMAERERRATQ